MLASIELDDQFCFEANEVADVRPEWPLAAESESVELPAFAIGALLVLSGVTTSHILTNYLLKGLGDDTNTLVASLLLCAAITYVLFGRSRAGGQLHLEKVS